MSFVEELVTVADGLDVDQLPRVLQQLPVEWIEQALAATGTATIRRRRLPAEQVIWLVIGMALMRGLPISEVVSKLDLALPSDSGKDTVSSAIAYARQRLGAEPLEWLFERTALHWDTEAWGERWRGLQVYAMDGTQLCVADTETNAAHFGRHRSGAKGTASNYPQLRMVWLTGTRTRMVRAATFGPHTTGELTYAKQLLDKIPSDSLLVLDRLYVASPFLLPLISQHERHFLVRVKSNSRWFVERSLGAEDELVDVVVSDEARKADAALPRSYRARAITVRTKQKSYVLLTSLLDPERYPASEIRALYRERWEAELAYDEFKTEMLDGEYVLRSKTVQGVTQEMWGALLAYNLVRLEMARVAKSVKLPPSRVSFAAALCFVCDEWLSAVLTKSPGNIPKRLDSMRSRIGRLLLPPRRSQRSYDRVVKRKESTYPRKRRPVPKPPELN